MPLCSVTMRRQRIEELQELAGRYSGSGADIIRYCVSVGIPKLRQILEECEPRN